MNYRLNAQLMLSPLIVIIVVITQCSFGVNGFECTVRRGNLLHAPLERFQCPRFMDKRNAYYCCGNEVNRYCCTRSKAIEHSFRHTGARGLLYSSIVVLLIIGACIVGCCLCCYWMVKRRKGTTGVVLSTNEGTTIGGQSVHMVNQQQPPMMYPNQPSYGTPMYPSQPPQPGFTQYPYSPAGDNPPAYYAATNAPPVDNKLPPFNPNYPH